MDMKRLAELSHKHCGEFSWANGVSLEGEGVETYMRVVCAHYNRMQQRYREEETTPKLTYEYTYNNNVRLWHCGMRVCPTSNIFAHGIAETPETAQIEMLRDARNCNLFCQGV